jgi:hypothetical protein
MKSALSHNEIEILDHQVATLCYQLSEIAGLLETRLGETMSWQPRRATPSRNSPSSRSAYAAGCRCPRGAARKPIRKPRDWGGHGVMQN